MSKLLTALQGVEAPKIALKDIKGNTFQGAAIQPTRTEQTNYSGQINTLLSGVGQVAETHINQRRARGDQRKNEILLKNMKPEELGALRRDGTLLYQDDPYAMRALEKELGRQEAYNVEGLIKERITKGDYNNRGEMEADRTRLMQESMKNMGETYGMPEGGTEYFNKGYQSDIVERNMAVYGSMAKKQDEVMRNEARMVVENNLTAVVKAGSNAEGTLAFLNEQRTNGVIRNDGEYETYLMRSLKDVTARADGVQATEELMNASITIDGKETTLRARMGEEAYNHHRITAANNHFSQNWDNQKWFTQGVSEVDTLDYTKAGSFETAVDKIAELEKSLIGMEGAEQTTQRKQEIEALKARTKNRLNEANKEGAKQLARQIQEKNRYLAIDARVTAIEGGQVLPLSIDSFPESEATGTFTSNDYALYYQGKAEAISSSNMAPEEKQAQMMKLGGFFKEVDKAGFGAQYTAQTAQIGKELMLYGMSMDAGQEAPETPTLNSFISMYKAKPQEFLATFGDDAETALMVQAMSDLGVSPDVMIKGQRNMARMSEQEKIQYNQEMTTQFSQRSLLSALPPSQQGQYKTFYASMEGIPAHARMDYIEKHARANNSEIELEGKNWAGTNKRVAGVIPNEFLKINPSDPTSVKQGQTNLTAILKEKTQGVGTVGLIPKGDAIQVNLATGAVIYITKEQIASYGKVPSK